MTRSTDNELSQKTEREVTAALSHLRKLLRIRNRLRSPLLKLPTETIIRILSLIMAGLDSYFYTGFWWSIYGTCHRIHDIMCSATELWWRVDWAQPRTAHFILARSKGNPRVIVSDLCSVFDEKLVATERILDLWRDKRGFRGHRLHDLEFFGSPSSFDHFSWILERPLPRVTRLKLHVTESVEDEIVFDLPNPVALELPMGIPLQVLDLRNVTLSWPSQSHLFNGLRELQLNFKDCDPVVVIPENELFGIFEASPQLERLSLVRVGHDVPVRNGEPLRPRRVIQFPNLVSLTLDNDPVVIKYTLAYMGLPVITSLSIRSFVSWDMAQTLKTRLFPDDRLPVRLFPNPPTFAVRAIDVEEPDTSIEIDIGSIKLRFDFPLGQGERGRGVVMSCIPSLVPSSITALDLEYTQLTERGWRDFLTLHPEVRSIECTVFHRMPVSRTLWDALSPAGEDAGIVCPKLESIFILSYPRDVVFTPLSDCLRNRQAAGFKLTRLRVGNHRQLITDMDGFHEEFGPLVDIVEAHPPSRIVQRVSPVSEREVSVH